jgi:hypothetical protein
VNTVTIHFHGCFIFWPRVSSLLCLCSCHIHSLSLLWRISSFRAPFPNSWPMAAWLLRHSKFCVCLGPSTCVFQSLIPPCAMLKSRVADRRTSNRRPFRRRFKRWTCRTMCLTVFSEISSISRVISACGIADKDETL